jgi:hypothetical protein
MMNREEILAKSQQENHGQDIVNLEASKNGMQIGWVVIICLLSFVSVVNAIVFERMNSEVFFAVTASTSVIFFYKYMKLHQKHELFVAVIDTIAAGAFLISWIIQLVG